MPNERPEHPGALLREVAAFGCEVYLGQDGPRLRGASASIPAGLRAELKRERGVIELYLLHLADPVDRELRELFSA